MDVVKLGFMAHFDSPAPRERLETVETVDFPFEKIRKNADLAKKEVRSYLGSPPDLGPCDF